jgi:hypothetical protein
MRRALALVAALPIVAAAQEAADTVTPALRIVEGRIELGRRAGAVPVPGAWVVVHRIASDASGKVEGGPLDSARTGPSGAYRIAYRYSGSTRATYIAITTYAGISYITSPLTQPRVSGDDGSIIVFDTTSPPFPVRVAGRHLIVTGPDSADRRRVVEVYELLNDSTLTVISSEAKPAWRAALPPGVEDLRLNPVGDITPGTAKQNGDWLAVFAPISPGLRQLSFTYTLPADDFPLSIPMTDSVGVFEVLVEEPGAAVSGAGLTEVAPVNQEGVNLRRFLARDAGPSAVVSFTMPGVPSRFEKRGVSIVVGTLALAMFPALGFALWRRRRAPAVAAIRIDPVDGLLHELAAMDAAFERIQSPSPDERAAFDARRLALKSRLTAALAARDSAS